MPKETLPREEAAQFEQANILTLSGYDNRFDTVVDIGCFHSLYDDADRTSYAASLYQVCRSGAIWRPATEDFVRG